MKISENIDKMTDRWVWFCEEKLKADPAYVWVTWPMLAYGYTEDHRYYHDLTHIEHCLSILDTFENSVHTKYLNLIEFALWFHDVVYNTKSSRNEEDSAEVARNAMGFLNCDTLFKAQVVRMIHLTKHAGVNNNDDIMPLTYAEQLFLDIDLSILGAEESKFNEYDKNIRREYSWVSDNVYNQKRPEILSSFLQRENIFQTIEMRSKFEEQARKNLRNAIDKLKV